MSQKTVVRRDDASASSPFSGAIHPVLARVFCARGVTSMDDLGQGLKDLFPYHELLGIECAAQLLYDAVSRSQCILIVADFDADGATSCALAVRALRLLGADAANIKYIVPNRFEYGYGLTPEIVAVASAQNPDLIITVDNGISSVDGVAAAKARGIRVLVTDHHLPGAALPAADCIVNPNQAGDPFGSKNLAGVGVIFYVMLALRAKMHDEGWFAQRAINAPNLAQLLDLVALGTVADVVPLDRNNRILVSQGLARIAAGRCCAGIQALLDVSGRNAARIVATDLGFAVAPRLNAAGRLEDMAQGIDCLLSDDPGVASEMAQQLDSLNRERRSIESGMRQQALSALDALSLDGALSTGSGAIAAGLCLYDESWHQGVIGILASRIKEKLHRPVIAFAPSTEAAEIKGSARSVPGVHIKDVLEAIAAQHPDMLQKFGGHAMAAGLTLARDDFEPFKQAFNKEVLRQLDGDELKCVVMSDGELTVDQLNLELAETLRNAAPWGQGFPEPLFDGLFEVINQRVVGENHLKIVLRFAHTSPLHTSPRIDAIAFNLDDTTQLEGVDTVRLAYKLDVNEYRGQRTVQLIVDYMDL